MSINEWMNKQNVVYPYSEILSTLKKEWSPDLCHNKDQLNSCITILFLWNAQNRQIHRDKNQWLPGAGGEGWKNEEWLLLHKGWWKCSGIREWGHAHSSVITRETTGSSRIKEWILWCVKFYLKNAIMILLAHWVSILYLIRSYHSYFQGLVMRIYSLCTGGAMNVGRRWNSLSSTRSYCLLRDTQTHAAGSHEGICDALGAYREPGSVRGVTETTANLTDSALPFWSFGSNRGEWEFF